MSRIVKASDLLLRAAEDVYRDYAVYGLRCVGGCTALERAAKKTRGNRSPWWSIFSLSRQALLAFNYFTLFKPMPCMTQYWFEDDVEHRITALLMARAMALVEGN